MRGFNRLSSHASVFCILVLALLAIALPAQADHARAESNNYSDYAEVVDVDPIIRSSVTAVPKEQCSYRSAAPARDVHGQRKSIAPTLVGGLIGGLIGNQFGSGRGKTALTFAGAITGAAIADNHQRAASNRRHHGDSRRHCRTVRYQHEVEQLDGYRVTYRYRGKTFVRVMDEDPGNRLRIRVNVMPVEGLPDENPSHS
jgi:uncharacterized protein YcfJ